MWNIGHQTIKRINPLLALLRRIKQYLDIPTRKLFFNAFILPHLDYCCTVWGNASETSLNKLLKLQKRAARVILDCDYSVPSDTLFCKLNWMPIQDRIKFHKAVLIYKSLNNLAPTYLNDSLNPCSNVHNRSLRATTNNNLYLPKPRTESLKKTFSYSGSKIWNNLTMDIKSAESLSSFKSKYIQHYKSTKT